MTRKFAWWGFSFILGLALFYADSSAHTAMIALAVAVVGLLALLLMKKYRVYVFAVSVCIMLGLLCGAMYTHLCYNEIVSYSGEKVEIDGYITDYSYIGSDTCMVTIKGEINGERSARAVLFAPLDDYDYYSKVSVTGAAVQFENSLKFQSQSYYYGKGTFLQVDDIESFTIDEVRQSPIMRRIMRYRDYISQQILANTSGRESGFLIAILCGDKSQMSNATKTILYRTGLGHLFAVSGTHLATIAMFVSLILKSFMKSKRKRFLVSEIVIWTFVAFAGFSVTVVRSAIMISVVYAADIFRRKADTLNSLGLCCMVMCITTPYVIKSPAFVMSITAAFSFGVVSPKLEKLVEGKLLVGLRKSAISLTVLLFVSMPFAIMFFSQVSIISPLSNILLVPICIAALLLVFVGSVLGGAGFLPTFLYKLAAWLVSIVMDVSEQLATMHFITVPSKYFTVALIFAAFGLLGVYITLHKKKITPYLITVFCAYLSLYSVTSFMSFADRKMLHIIILPDSYNVTVLVYKGDRSAVLDLSARGKMFYSVQTAMCARGVNRLNFLMIDNGGCFTKTVADSTFFPAKYKYLAPINVDDVHDFVVSSKVQFGGVNILYTDDGYEIKGYDTKIKIRKNEFVIGEKQFYLTEEGYPIEIIVNEEDYEVRRLDYAFNEQ